MFHVALGMVFVVKRLTLVRGRSAEEHVDSVN
jgi:hypothetical protein